MSGEVETVFAPVKQVDVRTLPVCVYEIGILRRGEPVFECPRCSLLYNSWDLVTPQCTNPQCLLKPVRLTPMDVADALIPPRVINAVMDAARRGETPDFASPPPPPEPDLDAAERGEIHDMIACPPPPRADEATIAARRAARPPRAPRPPREAPSAPME
jgi:hypothetical protein